MEHPQLSARAHTLIAALISYITYPIAYFIRFELMDGVLSYAPVYYHAMGVLSALLHYVVCSLVIHHRLDFTRQFGKQVQRTIACEFICVFVTLGSLYLAKLPNISRVAVAISALLNILFISLKHRVYIACVHRIRRAGRMRRRVLLIGEGAAAQRYADTVLDTPEAGHLLAGHVASGVQPFACDYLGGYDHLESIIAACQPEEAIIALPAQEYVRIESIIDCCERAGVPLRIIPCYESRVSASVAPSTFEGIKMIGIREIPLSSLFNAFLKRTTDIVLSLLLLVLLSPLMLATAVGVRLSSGEGVLFRQTRVGKDNKPFEMLKFRSMRASGEEDTAWTTRADSRRTPFGVVIRKLSIDELPQLVNVLRGEMSLVGPRPELPHYVEQFRDEIPLYMIRHMVKPGITGLAQINGCRGDTSIKKRIEYDVYYIENWTIWMDMRILLGTLTSLVNDEKLPLGKLKDL